MIKILLVDDDSTLLDTLADYFRSSLDAEVITALSVPSAIEKIDQHGPIDMIVSDYQLPPHTALDLAKHLRMHDILTPFAVHSGFSGIDESKFKVNPNYLGLFVKPANQELVALVKKKFPGSSKR